MIQTNQSLLSQVNHKIDHKTKPLGALGELENIARKVCQIQQTISPQLLNPHIVVFAGDHGIAQSGVSAYPPEVTPQMVLNFVNGGAAINVFCRQHSIALQVVDAGVNDDFPANLGIIDQKVGKGTRNFLYEPAMTQMQLHDCMEKGREVVKNIHATGCNVIGFGEMGIGNTSSASMLMHKLLYLPLEDCVGRGTGISEEQWKRKIAILKDASLAHPNLKGATEILQVFGGFEIAMMCGAILEAVKLEMVVLVDGFIASSAFLCAQKIKPSCQDFAFFCHQSNEKGHQLMLENLKVSTILNLSLRLGEGTGCALAYPIIQSAVNFINEMASFESAGVSNKS